MKKNRPANGSAAAHAAKASEATDSEATDSEATDSEATDSEACEHLVLYDVSWDFYERFLEEIGERPLRLNYDGKNLEIMNLSRNHERPKGLLARLIEMLTLELDIPIASGGSMTFRRHDIRRGLEPDECYWIASEPKVRGDHELDFTKDPPPDLVVEVERSRTVLDRKAIYAKLGVPEIWRYDGKAVSVLLLENGRYIESEKSLCFTFLPIDGLAQFLVLKKGHDENGQVRAFLKWIRKHKFRP